MQIDIQAMSPLHWPLVAAIYREGIATGQATFETEVPSWEVWNQTHLAHPRLVALHEGLVQAWAALSPVSRRAVYAGVAEVSIYVGVAAQGRGIGAALLQALIAASEDQGIWTLQATIFAINAPSIRLHAACGFRIVGTRERIGCLHGHWHDVVLMERRSMRVGRA